MFIDHQMAQKIVDRAMKVTGANVNVMDHRGVIIGSGDPGRIGQIHEGALHVLSSHGEVDIDPQQEGRLQGTKCGVNLPIRSQGEIVGVVGITGEPGAVRHYADLVVMTAELVVEQAMLTAQVQWGSRQRESVLLRLIEGGTSDSLLDDRIARLRLDLSLPRVAVVLELGREPDGEALPLAQLQRLQSELATGGNKELLAITSPDHIVLLKPVSLTPTGWDQAQLQQRLETQCQPLAQQGQLRMRLGVGDYFPSTDGLSRSYRNAIKTLAVARIRCPTQQFCFAHQFALDLLLYDARDSWAGRQLIGEFQPLSDHDRNGVLRKTLEVYLAENMDFGRTTERLHIHRNTLRYRLDKIATVLKLDLNRPEELLRLLVALRLEGMQEDG